MSNKPLKTAYSRVFLMEGRARGDHKPEYEAGVRMMGLSQGFGDIETIESPDPQQYGAFEEVGQTRGAIDRPTTSLEGRYALDVISEVLRLARKGCAIDMQLHMGECQDPTNFNTFSKALVLEGAYLTSYSTEDMGALASGDDSPVNESADISAKTVYEVVPVGYGVKAATIVTTELTDAVICDRVGCGECEEESDGCYKVFAISVAAGGSPSTSPDVVFSVDKGITWYAHDIESIGTANDADGIDCVGQYLVIVSNAEGNLNYALKSEFDGVTDPEFTGITTGIVVGGEPNAIFSIGGIAFVVGDGGYVYKTDDPTVGVSVLDAGSATSAKLTAVHALSEEFAVAVGENGAVIYTENGTTWSAISVSPVGYGTDINCVWVKSESEWWIGAADGNLYYTLDGGSTWTTKAFSGSGAGEVRDIVFSTDSVAWLAHDTAAPAGRILRSYDGGYSWQLTPESGATFPANDQVNALAVCEQDANFVVGVGLADNASDGYVVVGAG